MTQHSTRANSPLPGPSLWGRLLKRSWPVRLVLVAALLPAVPFLFHAGSTVHAADNDASLNLGERDVAENPKPAQPDNETPFQRFQRLAKKIVAAPKPSSGRQVVERE